MAGCRNEFGDLVLASLMLELDCQVSVNVGIPELPIRAADANTG